ncbi:60S ribosomal protein L30 [Mucor velutinosus]|uniref:60S ribosomal protein L30 n=1 Tax=Mucor velutinosus TaxID=708070 RepID=A0AAN7DRM3_9FUNG|nr:60S ribosomal protein L30 [Mucor velutinosus]
MQGDIPASIQVLNYREKSILSPVKLMTKMTRKYTRRGRISHFEISGYVQLKHNYEFGSMLYGGMLGLAIRRGSHLQQINMQRVQQAYLELCDHNPMLRQ